MCGFLCVCVYRGICLHLPSQITPHKHTPNTNTHTRTFALKEKEVWIMLALREGQANQTHLETIGDRALKQGKVAGREGGMEGGREGRETGGGSITALGGTVQMQSVGLLS